MRNVILIDKPIGMTPKEVVDRLKKERKYSKLKLGYAGRLDPMASGLLLLLVGDENKRIEKYYKFDKEYNAQILFGFKSDSYDLLGLVDFIKNDFDVELIKDKLKKLKGLRNIEIPKYSSPVIKDVLRGKEVKLPIKEIEIKKVKVNKVSSITGNRLLKEVLRRVERVNGDFRQDKIIRNWKKILLGKESDKFLIIDVNIKCSSGTYIRSIANELSDASLLFGLRRVSVGDYNLKNVMRIDFESSYN